MSGFDQSSCNITLNGTFLKAICKKADGKTDSHSTLDLNWAIANDNGRLVSRRGGNFADSCTDIKLTNGTLLTCTATKMNRSKVNAQIDLSTFIANIDGQLRAS